MHPVHYLFEDIYRNYWGISLSSSKREAASQKRQILHSGLVWRTLSHVGSLLSRLAGKGHRLGGDPASALQG